MNTIEMPFGRLNIFYAYIAKLRCFRREYEKKHSDAPSYHNYFFHRTSNYALLKSLSVLSGFKYLSTNLSISSFVSL